MKTWIAVALFALAGCGGADFTSGAPTPMGCTPGEQMDCSCAGGDKGVQVCNDQGTAVSGCSCEVGDSGTPGAACEHVVDDSVCTSPVLPKVVYSCGDGAAPPTGCIQGDATRPWLYCCSR